MKKQILKFGKALNKAEQRLIHGGNALDECESDYDCNPGQWCNTDGACLAVCGGQKCTQGDMCDSSGECIMPINF